MSWRIAVIAPLLLSLCGCSAWVGPAFYAGKEGVNPFSPGRYRLQSEIGDKKDMVVRWDGHHLYADDQASEKMDKDVRLTAVPLAVVGRDLFIVQGLTVERQGVALYAVLERNGQVFRADMPDCRATRDIAEAAGAKVETLDAVVGRMEGRDPPVQSQSDEPTPQLCLFPDRKSLEAAMRSYINGRQLSQALIERVGD